MNPLTNVKNIKKLSEQDLKRGGKSSWHDQYKDSAWLFIGGLPYDLTEGDIICVFSQYGEVVNINLVRDKVTGKQKGFCFLCYEDQRSTVLAVDNLNSIKILNKTLRVDHVENYKAPKESKKNPVDEETKTLREEGCGPLSKTINPVPPLIVPNIKTEVITSDDIQLPPRLPIEPVIDQTVVKKEVKKHKKKDKKKVKKSKKEKKTKKRKRKASTSSSDSDSSSSESDNSNDEQKRRRKH